MQNPDENEKTCPGCGNALTNYGELFGPDGKIIDEWSCDFCDTDYPEEKLPAPEEIGVLPMVNAYHGIAFRNVERDADGNIISMKITELSVIARKVPYGDQDWLIH